MKKTLVLLSICAVAIPCTSIAAHTKKHHKAHQPVMKDQPVVNVMKDEPAKSCWLDNLSGTFALTSDYRFRGISQTSRDPAVQGGLTYTFPIGLYFNVWGSNVNFLAPNGAQATLELDSVIGWQGTAGDDFGYNLNLARYNYPGARYSNYNEFNTLWTYRFLQIGISYTGNYSGTHGSGTYYNALLTYDVPEKYIFHIQDVSLQAGMGHYSLARVAGSSYNDFIATVNKKINKTYTLTAQWIGTNHRAQQDPNDANTVVGTITATF